MTDKKLTDNEIPNVKELLEYKAKAHCELCDLKILDCCNTCLYTAIKQFIELFNRLQEEKQNLEVELQAMRGAANSYKAEIERLEKAGEEAVGCFHRLESLYNIKCTELKVAKAEAYKEFWNSRPERLNEQCKGREEYNKGWNACLGEFWEIRNNLFYEFVGDNNAGNETAS